MGSPERAAIGTGQWVVLWSLLGNARVTGLAASDARPGVVLCSSSLRTRQTLAAILPALGDALQIPI
jgi:hypothetical protein